MQPPLAQGLALGSAFWTAIGVARCSRAPLANARLAAGLALGAAFAHVGWLLLHPELLAAQPGLLVDPSQGYCVLFVPLGVLLSGSGGAALACLPLAQAVARVGCVAVGCCGGVPSALPWARGGVHPTAGYEIAGLVLLHAGTRRAPLAWKGPLALGGLALARLLVDPLRAPPPLGAPALPAAWLAAAQLAAAAGWALARARRGASGAFLRNLFP